MSKSNWQTRFEKELQAAEQARAQKNEGRARVCARRAVGILLDAWFASQGIAFNKPSAYEKLRYFLTLDTLPEEVREVAQHFTVRVTTEYTLPIEADLIAEARWLCAKLSPDTTDTHQQ
ncbi:MAG: hypothetical protein D6755_08495 [Anaerolineae bacterium]|nr:MAG: hypothetical protein D6755_08495 [Anaerolineae bacterium]